MTQKRCGIIDFLRLPCAVVVVLLHSYYLTDEGFQRFVPHGHLAVEFFLIVSGFLMAKSATSLKTKLRGGEVWILRQRRSGISCVNILGFFRTFCLAGW